MSLFNQLLSLHKGNRPTEDFMTEVFAYCLMLENELLADFLKKVGVEKRPNDYSLKTQVPFPALKKHKKGSIPDMVLSFKDHIMFIENKVGAKEDEDENQLTRYVDHLATYKEIPNKKLIYITRDFDPKKEIKLLRHHQGKINFHPLRWHQIYRLLKKYIANPLIKETILFMAQNNLTSNNQFSPNDLASLNNFKSARKIMDDVLFGEITTCFFQLIGKKNSTQKSVTIKEFKKDRYIINSEINKIWIGLGFFFNTAESPLYPLLRLDLQLQHKNTNEIIDLFLDIDKKGSRETKWEAYNMNPGQTYTRIRIDKSLQDFMHQEDQVAAIKNYFNYCLDEFELIMPKLETFFLFSDEV